MEVYSKSHCLWDMIADIVFKCKNDQQVVFQIMNPVSKDYVYQLNIKKATKDNKEILRMINIGV